MSKNIVKAGLTPKRRTRAVVENDEYAAFARRILRAYARRVADGDIESLTQMITLADEVETVIRRAVTGLRDFGYSWADIGIRLGVTRQAAQQRFKRGEVCPSCGVNWAVEGDCPHVG